MHVLCIDFYKIQNFDMYRPYLPLSHLHDPRGHQEVHGGGVDQVSTYDNIVRYMFYTGIFTQN